MPPDAKNTLSLIDPIHLPSPRGTPVALPDPSAGPFLVPTLTTLVSKAVVQMYGSLTIQALDIIKGGWQHRGQALA